MSRDLDPDLLRCFVAVAETRDAIGRGGSVAVIAPADMRAALADGRFEALDGGRFRVGDDVLEPDEVLVERIGTDGWAVAGDGGFQMTLQELATIVQERIPVKIALMDNKKLGMIRQWQEIVYAGNYHSEQLAGPDYLKLCEAYGLPAWKVSKPEEVDAAVAAALAVDGPALIWFEIAERQNVYPMMPAGKGLSDLIDKWGDDGEDTTEGESGPRIDPTAGGATS